MKKRVLLLFVLMTALAFLFSCSQSESAASPSEPAGTAAAVTAGTEAVTSAAAEETDRRDIADGLPDELDFNGYTLNILHRDVDGIIRNEIVVPEMTGDVLNDAVFSRNRAVEERLNVKLTYTAKANVGAADFPNEVMNSILAGDDSYGLIAWGQSKALRMATNHLFLNLAGAKYLDLDRPWWNTEYIHSLTPDRAKLYFLVGDLSLVMIARMSAMFFNKNTFTSLNGDADALYDTVSDGAWTLDLLSKYVTDAYEDLNGNGTTDDGDRFGMITTNIAMADHFAYTSGMSVMKAGADGVPKLDLDLGRTSRLFDKLNALYYANPGTLVTSDVEVNNGLNASRFAGGTALFLPYWFEAADLLREMEDDFGIIPYPKLDETQEDYRALVQNSSTVFCLPVTCGQPDCVCAALEVMSAENYRTVLTAYYDTTLKNKYSRDASTVEMIDLIHDSVITDFGYAYAGILNNIGVIARTVLAKEGVELASTYASVEAQVLTSLDELLRSY